MFFCHLGISRLFLYHLRLLFDFYFVFAKKTGLLSMFFAFFSDFCENLTIFDVICNEFCIMVKNVSNFAAVDTPLLMCYNLNGNLLSKRTNEC